jgi:hypothetical protein
LWIDRRAGQLNILISHISEEASIADVFKDWIESTFLGQCEVFASSDTEDLPAGNKWINEIDKTLDSAVALLVLCSPASLKRPWINFETGWGWIKGVPIIPICHSGQKKDELTPRISTFESLEINSGGFVSDLFSKLAEHLGFEKFPRIDQDAMLHELTAAISSISEK